VTPRHGYGIMQETERMSQGRVKLAAGTLYGALNGLLDRGWIRAVPGAEDSRRKEYALTDKGKEALESELDRLRELVDNGESVLGGEE
ncbi:MAG: helix-turn-helix transcriptional regulator, partial [Clostridia bacterium]|nr:helix-turn-helix transcriptional regulator [Clostridia bacterium]